MARLLIASGLVALALASSAVSARAEFGFSELGVSFGEEDGTEATQAGGHPYSWTVRLGFNAKPGPEGEVPDQDLKDLRIVFPAGLVGSPALVPRCSEAEFDAEGCPASTAVGKVELRGDLPETEGEQFTLHNLVPSLGWIAEIGFLARGIPIKIRLGISPDSPHRTVASLANLSQAASVLGADLTIDGIVGGEPFLTLPRTCGGPLTTTFEADSWQQPGVWTPPVTVAAEHDSEPSAGLSGCEELVFDPTLSAVPTSATAGGLTGLDVVLDAPDDGLTSVTGTAHADLGATTVELPEGMAVNASLAAGLAACAPAEYAREAPASGPGAGCPEASKIGTARVESPLLEEPVPGSLYLAQPDDSGTVRPGAENPFDSLLAFYAIFKDAQQGVLLKQPIRVDAHPASGRLTATVADIPQLPFSHLELHFRDGDRAPLVNSEACGAHVIGYRMTPSSGGPPVSGESGFALDRACAAPSFGPSFSAGTTTTRAGASSSFVLRLDRSDREQHLSSLDLTLPPGVSADFGSVPPCPERAAEDAACPPGSRVGSLRVAIGAGGSPVWLPPAAAPPGAVFLAGPYRGAPYSLVAAIPGQAGPFDLGTVAVRGPIDVDRRTARASIRLDGLPQMRNGIPISYRAIRVVLDRPGFIRNPTSCRVSTIEGLATSSAGGRALLGDRFQVGGCARLPFKPKVAVKLLGPTHRGARPGLRAVVKGRPGDASIGRVTATLPGSELLNSRGIDSVCSAERFAAGDCPAAAAQGWAKVWTPLLDRPLTGPVYLRSSAERLPDLAAIVTGPFRLDLVAGVESERGRLRISFRGLPDVPLSKVALTLSGGRDGLLVNAGGICSRGHRLGVAFAGKNGKRHAIAPLLRTGCAEG